MNLHDINSGIHKHKKRKRVGRGVGSGHGKTSGRGHKGQGALAGWTAPAIFEGAKSPIIRRVPKRGFNNRWARTVAAINIGDLNNVFESGAEITPDVLRDGGIIKVRFELLKVLADGDLTKKFKISAHLFSKAALEKINQAGGEAIVLPGPAPVVKPEKKKKAKAST